MNKPLRIIQVVNVRWFNATAWYALFLSRLLKEAGHEVLVLGLEGTDSFQKAVEWGLAPIGLDLNTTHPIRFMQTYRKLSAIVEDFSPDVVNCHRGEGFFSWGLLRSKKHPFALIRTRGDQRPPKNSLGNRYIHQHVADLLIATNSATAFEFTRYLRCPEAQVHTILGGADTRVFRFDQEARKRVREEFGFQDDELVIGMLGRFDRVKGVKELIDAVARLKKRQDILGEKSEKAPFRLMLAGFSAGISQDQVQRWLDEEGLGQVGVITGKHRDVVGCISAMDLGVVASQGSEAIARAAFEIMSCGVPLVSTRIGVMPDLLPYWALVPPGDDLALTDLLQKALQEPDWRTTLREEALKCMASLSEQNFLETTLRAYHVALERRQR